MKKIVLFMLGISSLLSNHQLLTDPMLQNPTSEGVNVVWFTEFEGINHYVEYGERLDQRVKCQTRKLSRIREDREDKLRMR